MKQVEKDSARRIEGTGLSSPTELLRLEEKQSCGGDAMYTYV